MGTFTSLGARTEGGGAGVLQDGWVPDPTVVGSVSASPALDGARGCAVVGRYAYVCAYDSDSFNVIDVADPANPVIVATITDAVDLNGPRNIDVVGRYAYVCVSISAAVTIIDIANPKAPVKVGTVTAAALTGMHRIKVVGRYAYTTGSTRFAVVDVADPTAPTVVGSVSDATWLDDNYGFEIVGRYAYVAVSSSNSLTVIDISDPTAPVVVGHVTDTSTAGAHGVAIGGRYAYMTAAVYDGLSVIDISDPTAPVVVGHVTDTSLNGAHTVVLAGRYAYVSSNVADSLCVIDVSNVTAPAIVATLTDSATLDDVRSGFVIVGRYLYISDYADAAFTIVDLDGMTVPSLVAGTIYADEMRSELASTRSLHVHGGAAVGPQGVQSQGPMAAPSLTAAGLTGSTTPIRFVGGTTGGPPTTGAHLAGDFVITTAGNVWICTVAGTPGTWVAVGVSGFVRKTANESVTSSAVLQNDDALVTALAANATYSFEMELFYDGATTGDIRIGFTVPAGATLSWGALSAQIGASAATSSASLWSVVETSAGIVSPGAAGVGTKMFLVVRGIVVVGATAGSLQLQWAQANSDVGATTVFANSWLHARRVA